jgi:V-type H+-transporting ATPase subunit G
MASQTQGIQQLLAAEKRAAEKVSEARKRKSNKWLEKKKIKTLFSQFRRIRQAETIEAS